MYYRNENVENLHRIFDQNSRDGYLRLDLNENPEGLSQSFIDEVLSAFDPEIVARYPETQTFQEQLADELSVKPDELCLTNGSAEGIRHIIEAYTAPNGKVVSMAPTYAMYQVFSNMYGRNYVPVDYGESFTADLNKLIDEIDEQTQLVVLLNPNNPMGDVHSEGDVRRVIECAQEHDAMVLIDEAYYYFNPITFIDLAFEYDNVLITRTFSKLFSLAGCRLGYVVGQAQNVQLVQKMTTPHNVNAFSIAFASHIINTPGMISDLVKVQLDGKDYLKKELEHSGYTVTDSSGNFVFIKTKTPATEVVKKLKERKILVKHYNSDFLGDLIRITTGSVNVMKSFTDIFVEIDK